jgi:hypothetical protein
MNNRGLIAVSILAIAFVAVLLVHDAKHPNDPVTNPVAIAADTTVATVTSVEQTPAIHCQLLGPKGPIKFTKGNEVALDATIAPDGTLAWAPKLGFEAISQWLNRVQVPLDTKVVLRDGDEAEICAANSR